MIEGTDGFICSHCLLVDEPVPDELWASAKGQRNVLLEKYSWTLSPASPLTDICKTNFLAYLKQLNALTVDYDSPENLVWPEVPAMEYE